MLRNSSLIANTRHTKLHHQSLQNLSNSRASRLSGDAVQQLQALVGTTCMSSCPASCGKAFRLSTGLLEGVTSENCEIRARRHSSLVAWFSVGFKAPASCTILPLQSLGPCLQWKSKPAAIEAEQTFWCAAPINHISESAMTAASRVRTSSYSYLTKTGTSKSMH